MARRPAHLRASTRSERLRLGRAAAGVARWPPTLARWGTHLRPPTPGELRRNRGLAGGGVLVAVAMLAGAVEVVGGGDREQLAVSGTNNVGAPSKARPGFSPPSTSATRQGRRGSGQAVTLAFGGDVHFEGRIRARLLADPATVLAGVAPVLKAADVAVVNLETAVTSRGTPAPGKQYAFRAPASAFAALQAGGVDVASMANNHGLDFGRRGLEDSLDAAAAGRFPVVGIGRNAEEAYRPFLREVKGQRIAVLGATQVLDDDLRAAWTATDGQPGLASAKEVDRLTAAVRAARAQADTVVVFLHWGTEGQTCPNQAQPALARTLAEAGADVIVGGHAHRLQGAGRLGSAFVAYGLGNLVFYSDAGPGTDSGVLTVTVTGREIDSYRWSPARLANQLPRPLTGPPAQAASKSWEALRPCTNLAK